MFFKKKQESKLDVDAFTQHVMGKIEPDVFKTLNLVQLEAIRSAISANAPYKRHPVDIRGTISFYFAKYYFVVLIGRDRRSAARDIADKRLNKFRLLSTTFALYVLFVVLLPALLIILYLVKSLLGIDVFPDAHLSELLF